MLKILISLFFIFLPVGLSKHWIVQESLVGGILVDYLMPSLWLQDILAMIIIIFNFQFSIFNFQKIISKFQLLITDYFLPISLVLISILLSPVSLISAINFIRFFLAMAAGWVVYKNKDLHQPGLIGLSIAVFWTSLLAISQFINQGTVVGWWFLGEPIFSLGTGGVKKIFLFGQELVAPMATFPHANVMGAFGLLSFMVFDRHSNKLSQIAKYFTVFLIILSFSLPVWIIAIYLITQKFKQTYVHLNLGIVFWILILVVGYFVFNILPITSFYRRLDLIGQSLVMIRNYPLFGVGWGSFVKQLPPSTFFQPVHNVYLLILAELGIAGASGLVLVVSKYLKKVEFKKYLLLITVYLLLFLFDHYFWTTTQGGYMLWVMIGLF